MEVVESKKITTKFGNKVNLVITRIVFITYIDPGAKKFFSQN